MGASATLRGFSLALAGFGLVAAEPPRELGGFDVAQASVPREKIVKGGPPRDGIRSVDRPEFVPAPEATWVKPDTAVLGVAVGEDARAYPLHLLEWHQIVNDVLGGVSVVVTYDPLGGVPRAYRRTVEGRTLGFGVSGLLYNSNFLLYDRETESLWSQFLGRAVAGPLSGKTLSRVRIRQETLAMWMSRFPDSKVLARPEPKRIDYRYSPFEAYWLRDQIPFPVEAEDRRFHAKELVLGVELSGRTRAYLGSRLTTAGGHVEDELEGRKIRIDYWTDRGVFRWEVPDGVHVTEAYWFAWKAFHPTTEIWSQPKSSSPGP